MDVAGRVIHFSSDRSVGSIYCRIKGRTRWSKLCEARGDFTFGSGMDYRLRVLLCYGPGEVLETLKGVDCDLFVEVQVIFKVAYNDFFDSAVGGSKWLDKPLASAREQVTRGLSTRAALQFDTKRVR